MALPKKLKVVVYVILFIIAFGLFNRITKDDSKEPKQTEIAVVAPDNSIKGIMPVDVYLNLEKAGYNIDKQLSSKDGCFWTCTYSEAGIDYYVRVSSTTSSTVEEIRVMGSLNGSEPTKKIISVKPFLKYIASVPYEGSNPQKVAEWLENNFNKNGSTIDISGVRFTLNFSSKFGRVINIEKVK